MSEFSAPEVDALARRLCQEAGHCLEQVKLDLNGVCSACQAKKGSETESAIMKPLSAIPAGVSGEIRHFEGGHDFAARAISMGFTLGAEITVIQNYGRGPILVGLQGARIALGRGEAAKIQVSLL